jgi:hypothetical protein
MHKPGFLAKLSDLLAVSWNGGVRVRVWQDNNRAQAAVLGKMKGFPPERLMALVIELKPTGCGTVHFHNIGNRNWKIRVSGSLSEDNLEQRLRNIVVNS